MSIRGALFLLLSIWMTGAAVLAQPDKPTFLAKACPFFMQKLALAKATDINCGVLQVAENRRAENAARQLALFVVRISSENETANAPILHLEGGPGGAASSSFVDWLDSDFQADYDIILMDQRGSGLSLPSLNCFESDAEIADDDAEWIRVCRERLIGDGVDLAEYTSASSAHDIRDLLAALDIPQANIYGISYGTRLALTLVRDFPQRARSLIIDGVFPPQVAALDTQPLLGYRAFERLFVDCEENPDCRRAYPDLRDSFYRAIDTMNEAPAMVEDPERGALIVATGDDFVEQVYSLLYDSAILPYLPALVSAYGAGDYEFDPAHELELASQEEAWAADAPEADGFELAAMEYLNVDTLEEVYAHFDSLDEDALDRLFDKVSDLMHYAPFREFLGLESSEAARAYLDKLGESALLALEIEVIGQYDSDSEGLFYSVQCAEEIHFNSTPAIEARSAVVPAALRAPMVDEAALNFAACDIWDVPPKSEMENQPVESDVPTLILSGAYDPITPPEWGEAAANYLTNSWHYVFPDVGHGALLGRSCADSIALSFLADPQEQPADACMEALSPPRFFIRH